VSNGVLRAKCDSDPGKQSIELLLLFGIESGTSGVIVFARDTANLFHGVSAGRC
jgi:hypothetical protein